MLSVLLHCLLIFLHLKLSMMRRWLQSSQQPPLSCFLLSLPSPPASHSSSQLQEEPAQCYIAAAIALSMLEQEKYRKTLYRRNVGVFPRTQAPKKLILSPLTQSPCVLVSDDRHSKDLPLGKETFGLLPKSGSDRQDPFQNGTWET